MQSLGAPVVEACVQRKVLNEFDLPYGGTNMIFSGDFAQLPPVSGS